MQRVNTWVKKNETYVDGKIWVVNDEPTSQEGVRALLKRHGHELTLFRVITRVRSDGLSLYDALTFPTYATTKKPPVPFTAASIENTKSWR